jgi:hypothetical protein
MSATEDKALTAYLRRLGWGLSGLDEAQRREIVEETRAHVDERVAGGMSVEQSLAALGPVDAYARQFLDALELSAASAGQGTGAVFRAVLNRVHRSGIAAFAMLLVGMIWVVAASVIFAALLKPFSPETVGLWVGPHHFYIGNSDSQGETHEILGSWIYLAAPLTTVAAWWMSRLIMLWSVRKLAPR